MNNELLKKKVTQFVDAFQGELQGCPAVWKMGIEREITRLAELYYDLPLPAYDWLNGVYFATQEIAEAMVCDESVTNYAYTCMVWKFRLASLLMAVCTETLSFQHYQLHNTRITVTLNAASYASTYRQ